MPSGSEGILRPGRVRIVVHAPIPTKGRDADEVCTERRNSFSGVPCALRPERRFPFFRLRSNHTAAALTPRAPSHGQLSGYFCTSYAYAFAGGGRGEHNTNRKVTPEQTKKV